MFGGALTANEQKYQNFWLSHYRHVFSLFKRREIIFIKHKTFQVTYRDYLTFTVKLILY